MDPYTTLGELGAGLRSGAWSSVELTRFYLDRSRSLNPALNAFITLADDHALELAARADKRLRQGDATNLTGIPIAYKDIFCTKGLRTTCASRMLANFVAPYSATLGEHLDQAGKI